MSTIQDCKLLSIPKIEDPRGNLSVIENNVIPFEIKRVYYLYDVPSGAERGGHSHKEQQEFLVALSGSFDVILNDAIQEKTITLNKPFELCVNQSAVITPALWNACFINNLLADVLTPCTELHSTRAFPSPTDVDPKRTMERNGNRTPHLRNGEWDGCRERICRR